MIRHWWGAEPQCNVAVATGLASGIFAIDVDGFAGEAALRKLEAEHGELPPTIEVVTPRPGRHIYFRMPEALVLRNSTGKLAENIDVRATGGYCLTPPSIHPSGRVYCWSVDCAKSFADAPAWLLDRITERSNGNGAAATPASEWRALITDGVAEGTRDCTVAKLAGYLLRRHVDPIVALGLLQAWNATSCRPPLPADNVARIVDSIAGKELRRRQTDG
jgi:hypothetical protein